MTLDITEEISCEWWLPSLYVLTFNLKWALYIREANLGLCWLGNADAVWGYSHTKCYASFHLSTCTCSWLLHLVTKKCKSFWSFKKKKKTVDFRICIALPEKYWKESHRHAFLFFLCRRWKYILLVLHTTHLSRNMYTIYVKTGYLKMRQISFNSDFLRDFISTYFWWKSRIIITTLALYDK